MRSRCCPNSTGMVVTSALMMEDLNADDPDYRYSDFRAAALPMFARRTGCSTLEGSERVLPGPACFPMARCSSTPMAAGSTG
jgi:hypothetical protein